MRARITIAFVAILAVALVLAGTFSLLLVRNAENNAARGRILSQAEAIVHTRNASANVLQLIEVFQKFGVIAGVAVVSNGHLTGGPPAGISPNAINVAALNRGQPSSGVSNGLAFAIVPLVPTKTPPGWIDFSLTTKASSVADNIWYFLLAGGISLLVAGLVAAVISQRISKRVVAAAGAAERIAEGDLGARVPVSHSYPEIAALGGSINTMATNLERARNAEREFLLSVSHDLRTPLTSIRGYAEAIADGLVADPEQAASVVVAESARLARLIGDLLDLAKIDARQFSTRNVPIDVRQQVERAGEALHYEFESSEVLLEVVVPEDPVTVNADADRLVQVVGNLVDNARKFAASMVVVRLEADEKAAYISVIDDGPGVDPGDLEHIFERHFTSSRLAARAGGSGLGLAIVSELTAAMGGTVTAVSPLGESGGTRVTLSFPLLPAGSTSVSPAASLSPQG